jgi:hypothetical protein
MKQRLTSLGIILSLVAAPLIASAGDGDDAPVATTESASDCEKARARNKACVLEFGTPEEIGGGVPTGLGENIAIPGQVVFSSLIRIRTDFRDFILKTAEDLP